MKQKTEILQYYDALAADYDKNRFGNSYGQYLDRQERALFNRWLKSIAPADTLDLGCGTGRLLGYALNGIDFSAAMIAQAKEKFPKHQLYQGEISKLSFGDQQFKAIFSMHVFMHLDRDTIQKTLSECKRVLQTGGYLIVDFPNIRRRNAIGYKKTGWHANTALNPEMLLQLAGKGWKLHATAAFLLFPIHRIPSSIRKFLPKIDALLCRTFLKHFASYYCISLQKEEV